MEIHSSLCHPVTTIFLHSCKWHAIKSPADRHISFCESPPYTISPATSKFSVNKIIILVLEVEVKIRNFGTFLAKMAEIKGAIGRQFPAHWGSACSVSNT